MTDGREVWTLPDWDARDATRELGVRARATAGLEDLVSGAEALGFVEVMISATRNLDEGELCLPVPEDDGPAVGGVQDHALRDAGQESQALQGVFSGDNFALNFAHPATHAMLCLERNDSGAWVSARRLYPDGTLVRVLRRPDKAPPGSPMLTAWYRNARVPGLFGFLRWIAGDGFAVQYGEQPGVGRHSALVAANATMEDVLARLDALGDEHGPEGTPVSADVALVLSLDRRSMHVADVIATKAAEVSITYELVSQVVVFLVICVALAAQGASIPTLVTGAVVLWIVSSGLLGLALGTMAMGVIPLLDLTMWVGWTLWVQMPWAQSVAWLLGVTVLRALRFLAGFWLQTSGRAWIWARARNPERVPAADLLRRYPSTWDRAPS